MAELIKMPKLGFDMQEGTFANWVVNIGDAISEGAVIAEVETDKATVEVETYTSGTILHLMAEPGDILEVGEAIAVIGAEGESFDDLLSGNGASAPAAEPEASAEASAPAPAAEAPKPAATSAPSATPVHSEGSSILASPVARRIASEKGINLHYVKGTGPNGRIIKRDVENLDPSQAQGAAPAAAGAGIGAAPSYQILDVAHESIDVSRLRKTIARRMVESKQFVPHFTVTTAMDTSALLALRKELNAGLESKGIKITVNDMIVKATALALVEFPNMNTHFHGDTLARYKDINIGIAVALPQGGLINVVAKNADKLSLSALAAKNKTMIAGAREGKVRPEDIEGSTFTVSNLGAYGVEHFTAIINPPEAGILAIGASTPTFVPDENGNPKLVNLMKVTISVDHRTSDGAEGAQFVQYFAELIENPMQLLV